MTLRDQHSGHRFRRLISGGFVALGMAGVLPAASGDATTPTFAAIPDPPKTPASTVYFLDPDTKPISFRYTVARNTTTGTIIIVPATFSPDSIKINYVDGTGDVSKAPATVTVQVRFTYQGKTVKFTVPSKDVTLDKGVYKVGLATVATNVVNTLGNRLPSDFDPNNIPSGLFTIADVKFTVTPDKGNPSNVDPGSLTPKITIDESIGEP